MKCPLCGGKTWVYKTEHEEAAVVRVRVCSRCGNRFLTREVRQAAERAAGRGTRK